jgi:hypothetical protein
MAFGRLKIGQTPRCADKSADGHVNIGERFAAACLEAAEPALLVVELLPVLLSQACARVLDVAGAGISVFADDFRVPLGASDRSASTAEQLQFSLGEGPCLDAYGNARPFWGSEQDIQVKWPLFHSELVGRTPYRSIVSLPLRLSRSTGGAVDLYLTKASEPDALDLEDLASITEQIVARLSWQTEPSVAELPGPGWLHGPSAHMRTRIWIAIGMINAHFGLNAPDALAMLRAYAFTHEQLLDDLADRLVRQVLPVEAVAL